MIGKRGKSLLVAVMAVIAVSAYLASRESTAQILGGRPSLLTISGVISLGPLAGWILAARDGHAFSALWSLLPATVFSVGPLLLWISTRKTLLLVIASAVWVVAGYFYSVAIWV